MLATFKDTIKTAKDHSELVSPYLSKLIPTALNTVTDWEFSYRVIDGECYVCPQLNIQFEEDKFWDRLEWLKENDIEWKDAVPTLGNLDVSGYIHVIAQPAGTSNDVKVIFPYLFSASVSVDGVGLYHLRECESHDEYICDYGNCLRTSEHDLYIQSDDLYNLVCSYGVEPHEIDYYTDQLSYHVYQSVKENSGVEIQLSLEKYIEDELKGWLDNHLPRTVNEIIAQDRPSDSEIAEYLAETSE